MGSPPIVATGTSHFGPVVASKQSGPVCAGMARLLKRRI
jgi:hypothetical protein